MNPMIKGTLDGVLGNSFVEQRDPFKTNMWGEVDTGMMGEIPMWRNPRTGKMEPVDGYPGPVHGGGFKPIGTYDPNKPAKAEPIGTYDPNKPSFPVQLPYPAKQEEVAMEDWRKPYVKKWIRHHNPSDPFLIKDKDYLKNLQGIVLFNRPI
jgi:hypothetical protein